MVGDMRGFVAGAFDLEPADTAAMQPDAVDVVRGDVHRGGLFAHQAAHGVSVR